MALVDVLLLDTRLEVLQGLARVATVYLKCVIMRLVVMKNINAALKRGVTSRARATTVPWCTVKYAAECGHNHQSTPPD